MTTEERLYLLAGRLVPYRKKAEILEVAEDYAEHLETCQGGPESPKAFAKAALGDGKSRCRRSWLIAVAMLVLLVIWPLFWNSIFYYDPTGRQVLLLVMAGALPVTVWFVLGCGIQMSFAPRRGRGAALGLCAGLLALSAAVWCWISWLLAATMADPERFSLGAIGWMGRDVLTCGTVLAAAVALWSLWRVRRRSTWYFCAATQALAMALLCRGIWLYMSRMDLDFVPTPYLPVLECAGAFLVATLGTIVSAAVIARGAGKRGL